MSDILPFCQVKLQYLLDLVLDQSLVRSRELRDDRQAAERELEASEGRRRTPEAALREREWGHEL